MEIPSGQFMLSNIMQNLTLTCIKADDRNRMFGICKDGDLHGGPLENSPLIGRNSNINCQGE